MDCLRNFEDRLESNSLLSNVASKSISAFLRACSDATERFYIGFSETNLVTVDTQIGGHKITINAQNHCNGWIITCEGIVIGILN